MDSPRPHFPKWSMPSRHQFHYPGSEAPFNCDAGIDHQNHGRPSSALHEILLRRLRAHACAVPVDLQSHRDCVVCAGHVQLLRASIRQSRHLFRLVSDIKRLTSSGTLKLTVAMVFSLVVENFNKLSALECSNSTFRVLSSFISLCEIICKFVCPPGSGHTAPWMASLNPNPGPYRGRKEPFQTV